jgi:hypothetical protein
VAGLELPGGLLAHVVREARDSDLITGSTPVKNHIQSEYPVNDKHLPVADTPIRPDDTLPTRRSKVIT